MKSLELRNKLRDLESSVGLLYNELLLRQSSYTFLTEQEIDNWEVGEYFEIRNEFTGDVIDIQIVSIKEGDIMVVSDYDNVPFSIRFSELNNVSDKISLIELMEINLNN
jgi:hypothetical protein